MGERFLVGRAFADIPHVRRKSEGADVSTMEIDEEGETKEQRRARKEAKKAVSVV